MNLTLRANSASRVHTAHLPRVLIVLVGLAVAISSPVTSASAAEPRLGSFGKLAAPALDDAEGGDRADVVLTPAEAKRCRADRMSRACERSARRAESLLDEPASSRQAASTATTASGNTLSVSAVGPAFPSAPFIADFHNGYDYFTCNPGGTYYPEDDYAPCAQITFTDAISGASTPPNNSASATIFDACGSVVGGSTTYGWYTVGDPQGDLTSGGHAGGMSEWVSSATPPACAGTWTIVYSFTQTFRDGQTLTASASGTFTVKPVQVISPGDTSGGGNPALLSCQSCVADPVNTASGDYFEAVTDISIGGRGPGLEMERTYSSLAAASGQSSVLGPGWSFGYGATLAVDSGTGAATVTNGNGSKTTFAKEGTSFTAPPRVLATLVRNTDGTYTYTVRARTIYSFNAQGRLTSIGDLNGNKTTLAYNAAGRLQTATDGAARTLTFTYDAAGRLATVADSTGRQVSYGHDTTGDLTSVTDLRGGVWRFTYDAAHLLLTRKDAKGDLVMTNTYEASGRTLTQTDGTGHTTSFAYTGNPSTATTITDPRGNVTRHGYDNGLLVSDTRALGTPEQATWTYTYDRRGSLGMTSETDPRGYSSNFTYDQRGNQTSSVDSSGHSTQSSYDALNNRTSHTDRNGVTTTSTFDAKGNLLTSTTPLAGTAQSQTETYVYDRSRPGDVTAAKDALGNSTTFAYDAAGNLISETNAAGSKTTYTYNARGQRLTAVSPRGNVKGATPAQFTTTFTYDAAGNVLTVTDPLARKTTVAYDANGRPSSVTNAKGSVTTYTYDANGRRTKVARPDGTALQESYDASGNLASQTDGAGRSTTYAYDARDHVSSSTDPLGRTTTYSFDPLGNLRALTDALGRATSYAYDGENRMTYVSYSDGVTPGVSYGYDAEGRRTSMSDGSGTSTYAFDSLDRMTRVVNGRGDAISFGYDLADNQTSVTYPNGKTVTRAVDTVGRISSITDWLGNKFTFAYDADSNLKSKTFPTASANVDTYTYDNAGDVSAIGAARGTTTLASLSYTRNAVRQVTGETVSGLPGGSQTYEYNSLNQLSRVGASAYLFDPADNPTRLGATAPLSFDVANQLTTSPSSAYAYDQLGQRSSVTPATGTATGYAYDQAGRLVSVSGAATATYRYDGDGQRVSKTAGGITSTFAWNPTDDVPSLLSDGSTSYVYGPDGRPLEHVSAAGAVTYYHHDQLGSTRLLTSASGAVVGSFSYDAYGKPSASSGTATTPLGFAGEYADAETGLVYLRARYYDPGSAQFLTRDPLESISRQPYLYASGDPVNRVDPLGLVSIGEVFDATFGPDGVVDDVVPDAVSNAAAGYLDGWTEGEVSDAFGIDEWCDAPGYDVGGKASYVGVRGVAKGGIKIGIRSFAKKKSRGGPGKAPTGPKRPKKYRRKEYDDKDPRPGGRGPYRKPPPGHKGPWPPKPFGGAAGA